MWDRRFRLSIFDNMLVLVRGEREQFVNKRCHSQLARFTPTCPGRTGGQ